MTRGDGDGAARAHETGRIALSRHRWCTASLITSTCSRCGLRASYRGPCVIYSHGQATEGQCAGEPAPRARRVRFVEFSLREDAYLALRFRANAHGQTFSEAIDRMLDDAIARGWRPPPRVRRRPRAPRDFISVRKSLVPQLNELARRAGLTREAFLAQMVDEMIAARGTP